MAVTPDSGTEHDPQLAAAYRAGSGDEPPVHLDAAIRAAARREVNAAPGRARSRRWMVPLSLAAVMVLSVSVVLVMQQEGADQLDPVRRQSPRDASPAAADAQENVNGARPPAIGAPSPQTAASPAAIRPAPVQSEPARAPQPDAKQQADTASPQTLRAGEVRAKAAAEAKSMETEPEARRERSATTPAPALLRSAPALSMGDARTEGATAGQRAPTAALGDALWRDLADAPPAKWIERIAQLRSDGRIADADTLVTEFLRRFPEERLPEHLR